MKLARYHSSPVANPFSGLDSFLGLPGSGFSHLFDVANRLSGLPWDRVAPASGAASLFEDDENFYVRIEYPGVKKNQLALELNGNQLSLKVTRDEENSESRTLTVPDGVDADKIGAKLEDGILTITLGKSEAQKPRSIKVK